MADVEAQRKAAFELQDRMSDAHLRLRNLQSQQRMKERSLQEAELVAEQIRPLPEDARVYRTVGRAYFLAPKGDVLDSLVGEAEKAKKELESMKSLQEAARNDFKEAETSMAALREG
ncbi:unnamed protein product [Ostreobium quekettii]|uniref:Prefoldin n=1 Tax=Ostreobium quekettii TaxID=121088 RepID=A0A8S1IYH4_9CHLO|nr:unnamed protein product [Ostreobium quekettii]|eukprot:evm.model.scf_582.2 EVM.evm.TU.scf_582.2   scf_582:4167-5996(-)